MKLIIGGFAQGKLHYVTNRLETEENGAFQVIDETSFSDRKQWENKPGVLVINHVHRIVRKMMEEEPQNVHGRFFSWADELFRNRGEECLVFISDEIGCGVIPAEKKDRDYREETGRIVCDLAKRSGTVIRMICGIAQRIK